MIRNESEYNSALERLWQYEAFFSTRKSELRKEGLSESNAEYALKPAKLLYEQVNFEVKKYNLQEYYISLPYAIEVHPSSKGGFVATIPGLPGASLRPIPVRTRRGRIGPGDPEV